ncbi:MAG: hypothetical protein Q9167_005995 [Letrouitia subvulpina]
MENMTKKQAMLMHQYLAGSTIIDPTTADAYFNSSIPQNLSEIFSSATSGTTLSGAFDIQSRAWAVGLDYDQLKSLPKVDRGLPYAQSAYRSLDSLILHNKIEALEGIIVDSVAAGIGYRNHSMPQGLPLGGKWTEDVTWIEPVTECTNTNLTIEILVGDDRTNITKMDLIDNGGFINLPGELPYQDELQPSQDPNLLVRAIQGAYLGNSLLMFYFNVNFPNNTGPRNSSLGRRFSLEPRSNSLFDAIALSDLSPRFVQFLGEPHQSTSHNVSLASQAKLRISEDDWTDIRSLCEGPGWSRPKISNVHISCGYLYGAPRLIDQGDPRIFQPRSKWNQSLYVCASGARSYIKTVDFSVNSTASLDKLNITKVQEKIYESNATRPLWAVERTYKPAFDAPPLWGMVADRYENSKDLSTLRADKFWIPAIGTEFGIEVGYGSMASTVAFAAAFVSTYKEATLSTGTTGTNMGLADYSGSKNAALNQLWQELSQSPTTASRIINLIYMEIIATATVGTKSAVISPAQEGSNSLNKVVQYKKQLQYDWRYAIPAIAELLIVLSVAIALVSCLVSRFSLKEMSQLLNQTSTARIVTNLLYPNICESGAKTKDWTRAVGDIKLQYPFTDNANLEEKKLLLENAITGGGEGASLGTQDEADVMVRLTNSSGT